MTVISSTPNQYRSILTSIVLFIVQGYVSSLSGLKKSEINGVLNFNHHL